MKKSVLAALILMPAFAFGGVKEDIAKIDAAYNQCLELEENQNTAGMGQCGSEAIDKVETLLEILLAKQEIILGKKTGDELTDKNNAEILKRLKKSQKTWEAHVSANAQLQGTTMLGGSAEGLMIIGTILDMTKDRLVELDELLEREI